MTVRRADWLTRLIGVLLVLAWGLWFGAIVMVFVAVTSLFETFAAQRQLAGAAAAGIFRRFEWLHLAAAAVAVAACAASVAFDGMGRFRRVVLLVPLALAAGAALTSTIAITPRIDELRQNNRVDTPAFKKLHGVSMSVYSAEAICLLVAGLLLPAAIGYSGAVVVLPPDELR